MRLRIYNLYFIHHMLNSVVEFSSGVWRLRKERKVQLLTVVGGVVRRREKGVMMN